ncbi:MAG: baseplate J/gp47 family protein [Alphaproteobacteria bacterium]
MAYSRPTLSEIVESIDADLTSRLAETDTLLKRSILYVISRVLGGVAYLLYGFGEWISKQIIPRTSDEENLKLHASWWGITQKPATAAEGYAIFSGVENSIIPAGSLLKSTSNGLQYSVNADATISGSSVQTMVTCITVGVDGNLDAGSSLSMISPIAGVNSSVTVASEGITSGTDKENIDSLLSRLENRVQSPPHGGNEEDYVTWAKEVSGVTRAWVFPKEMGDGTVTVRFVMDDKEDTLIPTEIEVQKVQEYIDDARPVTADVYVVAPVAVPINFTINISPSTVAVKSAVIAEIKELFIREAEPGKVILKSHIDEAISIATGEEDHKIVSPTEDISVETGEIATFGTITWGAME